MSYILVLFGNLKKDLVNLLRFGWFFRLRVYDPNDKKDYIWNEMGYKTLPI